MDASHICGVVATDTAYVGRHFPWYLVFTTISNDHAETRSTRAEDTPEMGLFCQRVLTSPMTVIHIHQERLYMVRRTVSALSVDEVTWRNLLGRFDVPPSFVELLHNNNGGAMAYTSYSPDDRLDSVSSNASWPTGVHASAFHIGYKWSDWCAAYGRYDFARRQALVLVLGRDDCLGVESVQRLLQARPGASMFHVVQVLHSHIFHATESARWTVDHATQEFESLTGVAAFPKLFGDLRRQPLQPHELQFNERLHQAVDSTRFVAFMSARVSLNLQAFLDHLAQYEAMGTTSAAAATINAPCLRNLRQAASFKHQLARNQWEQIQVLIARLHAQISVTKTLMAQRDTQINLGIAGSARRDSELMRGITVVTMVFLPATFVATFFSMVFFNVGADDAEALRFLVDRRVWLYPTVHRVVTPVDPEDGSKAQEALGRVSSGVSVASIGLDEGGFFGQIKLAIVFRGAREMYLERTTIAGKTIKSRTSRQVARSPVSALYAVSTGRDD
ncbi:hypothetical protein LTR53_006634 [Teratosphaeriaceae sp. CCFEE 6253]|nr:hypothetical protein LTR53_006634 [Teratosphaeriaceae sp. CCFEE 6253]